MPVLLSSPLDLSVSRREGVLANGSASSGHTSNGAQGGCSPVSGLPQRMSYPLDEDACMTPTNFAIAALYWIKCAFFALFGAIFFIVFWPLGLVFAYYAIMAGAEALDAAADRLPGDKTVYTPRENGRSMEFGPAGPPWGDAEPPLVLDGRVVFPPSIRSIDDRGAKGPDLRVRDDIATPIPGTEASAYVAVTLHSGDTLRAHGEVADRLRSWFDRVAAPEPLPLPPHHE